MTLQPKLSQIGTSFSALTQNCYHYWRPVKDVPCIIWAETNEEYSFNADNHKTEQRIVGLLDCYTKTEFDPLLDSIQQTFDDLNFTWSLSSVQYEDGTKLIHYQWNWGVTFHG